jgi:hypothetical protein
LYPLAISIQCTWSHGKHFGLVQLLDSALWQKYASGSFHIGFYSLDQYAVEEGRNGFDGLESGSLEAH